MILALGLAAAPRQHPAPPGIIESHLETAM